jgi:hydroxyethylthiazole kinase-like uncharacterized protein yjeF
MTQIYQVAQIREFENIARERFGISESEMMQRAGMAAFNYLTQRWPDAKSIAVFCGTGNNGGDGYILAEAAHKKGLQVQVYQIGDPDKLTDSATAAYVSCKKAGVSIQALYQHAPWHSADVLVDAIYGIGLHDDIPYEIRHFFSKINKLQIPVLALDIPSGVYADTGAVLSIAVKATATITFIGVKFGLVTGNGINYAGDVHCDDLKFPAEIFAQSNSSTLPEINFADFTKELKPRPRDMHKGQAGHVLIVGGDPGHSGAPRLAAEAAFRIGAGLVTVATHPDHAAEFNLALPEIMCIAANRASDLKKILSEATVIVVGPGLGQSSWAKELLKAVFETSLPLVVDADALNLLAENPSKRSNWILTPHPGEAARLLKNTTAEIQEDRVEAIKALQQRYDGICVLKGAGTLVNGPLAATVICYAGNPGMATAGMGDVLSGVIGGLVAQKIPLLVAAKLGVLVHATAGDKAAEVGGERGMIATDLMPYLREVMNGRF